MIRGIGIDTVDIARFAQWHAFSKNMLERILSDQEIEYCLLNTQKSAQRFAVRFAAREALYKALSAYSSPPPFLTLCKAVCIIQKPGSAPMLQINWNLLPTINPSLAHLSLTHTQTSACAFVILEAP